MVGDRVAFVVAILGLAGCGGGGEQPAGSGGAGGASSSQASSSTGGEGGAPLTGASSGSGSICPGGCLGAEKGSVCMPDGTCGCHDSSDCSGDPNNYCGKTNECFFCSPGYQDCNGDPLDGCESHPKWDAHNCGACGHDCGGGSCDQGVCGPPPTTLVTSVSDDDAAIAVDDTRVFFASDPQKLNSVPLAGGVVTTLSSGLLVTSLTLDAGSVYWTGASIAKIAKDGGNVTTLVGAVGLPPHGIVSDGSSVFYGDGGAQQIFSVPTGGGAPAALVPFMGSGPIRVDAASLYYHEAGAVMKVPKGGGVPSAIGQSSGCFDVDGTHAYSIHLGALEKIPLGGGNPVILGDPGVQGLDCGALANDADNVYFGGRSSFGAGDVLLAFPKSGGAMKELAFQGQITSIAVGATHVYFVGDHDLKRVAK